LLPLLLTGRAVRLLNEVVLPFGGRDRDMFGRGQLGHFSDRRAVAPESIGDDALGNLVVVKQPPEETLGCAGITMLL